MNRKYKFIFVLLLLILIKPSISFAAEFCVKSDEYKAYEKLSDEEKENVEEPKYCKEENGTIVVKNNNLNTRMKATVNSTYYNALDDGIITSVKNQRNIGACWAFSAISLVETNALKNGLPSYDFSEAHMLYTLLKGGYDVNDTVGRAGKYESSSISIGGKPYYAASYYFNNGGQLLESEMAYPGSPQTISSSNYPSGRSIITLETFEINNISDFGSCTTDEITKIKQKILDNGSVQAVMYFNDSLFTDATKNYYLSKLSNSNTTNHGVVIVGWDDNVSKSNFKGATRNGAWIIKNSYGDTWSQDGYFYISYDDDFICKYVMSYYGVSNKTFSKSYKSSDLISFTSGFSLNGSIYTSARFKKDSSNETIKRVSFAVGANTSYKVYLSKNNIKTDTNNWIEIGSGYSDSLSVRSINTSNIVVNGDYTIIVKYTSDQGVSTMLPSMCNTDSDVERLDYSSNLNYITTGISTWFDMHDIAAGDEIVSCEPTIYVYTDGSTSTEVNNNTNNVITPKNNNKAKFINDTIYFAVAKGDTLTTSNITDYITISKSYVVVDSNLNIVDGKVGSGYKMRINGKYYPIIVLGDSTGDGAISSTDLLRIAKYIKGITNLDDYKVTAADTTKDGIISSGDLLRLLKYLKGTVTFTV